MARVWADSSLGGSELLMLLAIADFADDDGRAYPAVTTLATKCRIKPRAANYLLAALKVSGELDIRLNEGPRGTNLYRVALDRLGVQSVAPLQRIAPTPAKDCSIPLQRIADEPSLNHQEPKRRARKRADPSELTFSDWYARTKLGVEGGKIFEPESCLHAYRKKVKLSNDFVALAWQVFKAKHAESQKKQLDWRRTFETYVRNGFLRLWYVDKVSGDYMLSTVGVQAAREHDYNSLVPSRYDRHADTAI